MMEIKQLKISELKAYSRNPKAHPDKQIEKIANSIKEFGFNVPILVDKNNEIIAGHGRYLASQKLGLTEVPVIKIESLTPEQVKAYRIADNRLTESGWEYDFLMEEIADLKQAKFDLELLGFTEKELNSIMPQKEVVEDTIEAGAYERAKAKTKIETGDIFELGNHRLMCGDATIKEDVDKLMDGNKADLLLTDPPYGIDIVKANGKIGFGNGELGFHNKEKDTGTIKGSIGGGGIVPVGKHKRIENDDKPFNPEHLMNYGKNQIIWGGNYFASKLPDSSCWVIWDKREDVPSNNFADCEIAWTSFKKPSRIYRQLWSGLLRKGERDKEMQKRVHPTQKPVGIHGKLLEDYSQQNSIILDLYGGSGTTLIACEELSRRCFMMEIDPVYCQIIIDRWEKFTNKKANKL